ncbi:MAG: preprotein translocase subunit YajC [Oscillospiraceae bacterium]|jgi:preprotein translocase subunit YajC|nr:preprotein translocase subunit YajC [Oscillospiraceae bacterium]
MEILSQLLVLVPLMAIMYFVLFRPQLKRKKEEEQMRSNLKIGDEVTTIGGIIGRVVNIKDETDSLVIETSIDRSKVLLRRWAIASCIPKA